MGNPLTVPIEKEHEIKGRKNNEDEKKREKDDGGYE